MMFHLKPPDQLSNHLGSVLVVVFDRKEPIGNTNIGLTSCSADVKSATDSYPFGIVLQTFESDSYSYGFNGMEKDDEIKGNGNSYDFGARMHDARLGRWIRVDPFSDKCANESPYNFDFNSLLILIDPDGKEPRLGQLGNLKQVLLELMNVWNMETPQSKEQRETYPNKKKETFSSVSTNQKLMQLMKHFEGNARFNHNEETGGFDEQKGSVNVKSYIYTETRWWIDLHYFFTLAQIIKEHGQKYAELYSFNSERYLRRIRLFSFVSVYLVQTTKATRI